MGIGIRNYVRVLRLVELVTTSIVSSRLPKVLPEPPQQHVRSKTMYRAMCPACEPPHATPKRHLARPEFSNVKISNCLVLAAIQKHLKRPSLQAAFIDPAETFS
jgi:hypothetical protein